MRWVMLINTFIIIDSRAQSITENGCLPFYLPTRIF